MSQIFLSSKKMGIIRRVLLTSSLAVVGLLGARTSYAVTSLKQVQISNGSQIDLLFDGKVQRSQIHTEFINDIIQINIQDVSVYPAKISSVNGGSLTKIFAYQYAPKLVRCRLSVKGKAEDYKDRLEIKANGRILTVRMQGDATAVKASMEKPFDKAVEKKDQASAPSEPDAEERALLGRVMAQTGPLPKKSVAPEAAVIHSAAVPVAEPAKKDSITVSSAAPAASAQNGGAASGENTPLHLNEEAFGKSHGPKALPSPLAAFGKMGIVLVLFGIFAFGLKRYAQSKADGRLGKSNVLAERMSKEDFASTSGGGGWLSALGRLAKKGLSRDGRMIEVLSTHYLGPKKSIAVVRVAGRVLVLGVSNESINLITQLSGEDAAEGLSMESLGLGELAPVREPAVPATRPAPRAKAAGGGLFDDLLHAERSKPTFGNPAGPSAYAEAAGAKNGPNVRAQIRNRLEGLKQL